jgi:hypothetical protein
VRELWRLGAERSLRKYLAGQVVMVKLLEDRLGGGRTRDGQQQRITASSESRRAPGTHGEGGGSDS